MKKRNIIIINILLLTIVLLAACSQENRDNTENQRKVKKEEEKKEEIFNPEPNPDATQISSYNDERLKQQEEVVEEINSEYEEETYTFEDPFIKVNPYNVAPLTALLKFETETPVEIEVIVGNGEDEVPIEKKWDGYETEHEIAVLGLYPDTN